jgi:hypothetical protein
LSYLFGYVFFMPIVLLIVLMLVIVQCSTLT